MDLADSEVWTWRMKVLPASIGLELYKPFLRYLDHLMWESQGTHITRVSVSLSEEVSTF
jgi:hypothetical protein